MITNNIKYGGTLNIGDFICIGSDWGLNFGWYCGNGKANNIQYINPVTVIYAYAEYNRRIDWSKDNKTALTAKDKKGFSLDHIGKTAVRNHKKDNVVKIVAPDGFFSGSTLIDYNKAKEILTKINLLRS